MAIFYKNIDTVRSPISSPEKPIDTIIDTKWKLTELKAAIKSETDAAKRKELERKLNRMEKFDRLQDGIDIKDTKTKEDIQKILKWKNTETYSNSDLLTLRKKNIDTASLTLVNKQNADQEVKSNELKSGDSFTVNFGANPSLRDRTGAGDILPPSVRNIKINGVECERKNTPRPGYYDAKWKYQKILDGYTIDIVTTGPGTDEDNKANEKQWKNERLEDMVDNNAQALTDITEDKILEKESGEEIQERKKFRTTIGTIRDSGIYGTNKPIWDTVKLMKDLNGKESAGLARKIFHDGPATWLLISMDGGSGDMIKRMIALGYHEGWLKFGRQNPDPASWFNIGTFQIWGSRTSKEDSLKKYEDCMNAGIRLAKSYWIDIDYTTLSDPGQKDLITHLGYIQSQRGGSSTFEKLRDPNLSENALVTLMHKKIQGWIPAIWESVVAQIKNTKIDTSTIA